MEKDAKSRVDTSVPKPEATDRMSEEEKRALELSGQIEHFHGKQRDKAAEQAQDLTDSKPEGT